MNKLINKVKDNQYKRKYQRLGKPIKIVLLTDAAFGNLSNGSSQGEQVLFLIDGYGKWNLVSWLLKRIKRISRSTLAAEIIAMVEGVESAI